MDVIVAKKSQETEQIVVFELVDKNGGELPPFSAGSHIDVELPGEITRQYSLCNSPSETHRYMLGVLQDDNSRGGSQAFHRAVQEGDILTVSQPRNHFPLVENAEEILLLAGGIGVTPILCMAHRLCEIGRRFELHYCTRSKEKTAFLTRLSEEAFKGKVVHHFDDGSPEQKLNLSELLKTPKPGKHLYVCGPDAFMNVVIETALNAGWDNSQVHFESFGKELVLSDEEQTFEVELAKSGRTIVVTAEQTVAEALDAAGVDLPVSCEQGVCGTCLTKVLDGVPDHRDMFLTDEEQLANDQFLPCCSRAKTGRLVIDL